MEIFEKKRHRFFCAVFLRYDRNINAPGKSTKWAVRIPMKLTAVLK